jgi:hypothetical protein
MKRLLCAVCFAAGVSSPVFSGEYIVGTRTKEKEKAAAQELTIKPQEAPDEYGDATPNVLGEAWVFGRRKSKDGFPAPPLRTSIIEDDLGTTSGPWTPTMSTETLEYLTTEGVLPITRQELRGIKKNIWLADYKDNQPLPLNATITIVTRCEIAMARAWMKELGIEVPHSENTADSDFSWNHIYYGEDDPPEHWMLPEMCESPVRAWFGPPEGKCPTVYNRVHYQKVLEYAEAWKKAHPEKQECFIYREWKSPKLAPAPPESSWVNFLDQLRGERRNKKLPRAEGSLKRRN